MDRDVFAGDVKSVFQSFKGDDAVLLNAIKLAGYPEDFVAMCKDLASKHCSVSRVGQSHSSPSLNEIGRTE
jgi:hypothetical protein